MSWRTFATASRPDRRRVRLAGEGEIGDHPLGEGSMDMTPAALRKRLEGVVGSGEPSREFELVVEELEASGVGRASVRPILLFMEAHPDVDMGMPGPLTHHVETFFGAGYEGELVSSLARRPTAHTVWMLHRVIRGLKEAAARTAMVEVLRQAARHPAADSETRQRVAGFLRSLGVQDGWLR